MVRARHAVRSPGTPGRSEQRPSDRDSDSLRFEHPRLPAIRPVSTGGRSALCLPIECFQCRPKEPLTDGEHR
jgi:hypothetical protein